MDERARRVSFLFLFAVVMFQMGAHTSQAFVNYPAWKYIGAESFPAYHRVMTSGALRWLLLPRVVQLESLGNTPDLLGRLELTDWLRQALEWPRAGLYLWMAAVLLCPPLDGAATGNATKRLV